jgi:hypothetical protein
LSVTVVEASLTMWTQTYGGGNFEKASSLVETPDGGYAILGYTWSDETEEGNFWLVKTDVSGNMQWNRTYGGGIDVSDMSIVPTSDGGFAIVGSILYIDNVSQCLLLLKTDALGNMEWNQTYGEAEDVYDSSVVVTPDGGFALAGSTFVGYQGQDFLLIRTDISGNMQWNRTYGISVLDKVNALVATSDGGFVIAGDTGTVWVLGDIIPSDFLLVKTDASGNEEWIQTYPLLDHQTVASIVETPDGGFALAGHTGYRGVGGDFWLVKTDASGNMEWNQTYGGPGTDFAYSLVVTSDGGLAVVGSTERIDTQDTDLLLVKTDASGDMEWNRTYGGTEYDYACSLVATSDGGYAMAGSTSSFGAGDLDFWLVKTDEYGIVPEFHSWIILPLFLCSTFALILVKKKTKYILKKP